MNYPNFDQTLQPGILVQFQILDLICSETPNPNPLTVPLRSKTVDQTVKREPSTPSSLLNGLGLKHRMYVQVKERKRKTGIAGQQRNTTHNVDSTLASHIQIFLEKYVSPMMSQ